MPTATHFTINHLRFLDPQGQVVAPIPTHWDNASLVPLFKHMLYARHFDTKAIALQRTGKLGTYPPCLGHEATHVGIGEVLQEGDIFAPSYRECASLFMRGVRPRHILLYWGGDERGSDFPRDSAAAKDFPYAIPISTQCLHAAGAAHAIKLQGLPHLALACCGDGGTSKADFYGAVNLAGAYTLPLILCVINNGWAISMPTHAQTSAQTLAQKGIAGGLHCIQVDGNDLIAVREALREARIRALSGRGGSVIEFITYRLSDHTTADDARRYRLSNTLEQAWKLEPFLRLRQYLCANGLWSTDEEHAWLEHCAHDIDNEITAYLTTPAQPPESMFDYLFAQRPAHLESQRDQLIAFCTHRSRNQ